MTKQDHAKHREDNAFRVQEIRALAARVAKLEQFTRREQTFGLGTRVRVGEVNKRVDALEDAIHTPDDAPQSADGFKVGDKVIGPMGFEEVVMQEHEDGIVVRRADSIHPDRYVFTLYRADELRHADTPKLLAAELRAQAARYITITKTEDPDPHLMAFLTTEWRRLVDRADEIERGA